MVAVQSGPTAILEGETAYLYLSVFLTGGPQIVSSPFPALSLNLELYPGNWRQFTWAAAAMRNKDEALDKARAATARPWEAEQTRVELLNQSETVHIQTGNPEWDAAFALTQKSAIELFIKNPASLPHATFVLSRRPDHGFSMRGDGNDQTLLWGGQTALDTYYLASLLLPGAPDLIVGLLRNFISIQETDGTIDWKPGLNGQRSRRMAQPLLAAIALQVAPYINQLDWYNEVFPPLLQFFDGWFSPKYDKDGDGFPEWENPLQTGVEDSPIFNRWSPTAQGMQVGSLECPAHAAMLLRECRSLIQMANVLIESQKANDAYARLAGVSEEQPKQWQSSLERLKKYEEQLLTLLDSAWDPQNYIYHYRDFQTHQSLPGDLIAEFMGPGKVPSRKRFKQPRRLVIHLIVSEERSYPVIFSLHGFTADGEITETFTSRSFSWHGNRARATSQNTYLALKRFEVFGLDDNDSIQVFTADCAQEDVSLFLPLWAEAPNPEKARLIIEQNLWLHYVHPFGIPLCPPKEIPQSALPGLHTSLSSALLPWNQMIGEGLLNYGYRAECADLFTRIMNAIIPCLKNQRAFYQYYDAYSGLSAGERGHLHGLAPVGFFLKILGIRQLGEKEILLDGFNPFPWIVNVQYRKVRVTCYSDRTEVTLKGDRCVTIDRPGLHRINLI